MGQCWQPTTLSRSGRLLGLGHALVNKHSCDDQLYPSKVASQTIVQYLRRKPSKEEVNAFICEGELVKKLLCNDDLITVQFVGKYEPHSSLGEEVASRSKRDKRKDRCATSSIHHSTNTTHMSSKW